MRVRVFLAVVILAAVVAVLISGRHQPRQEAAPAGTTVSLRFWHIQVSGPTQEAVGKAVQRMQAAHPGLTVKAVGFKNDAYKTKLSIAMESGSPPDVFHTWGGGLLQEYVTAGKVAPIALAPRAAARFNQRALEFCYAVPPGARARALYALPADVTAVAFWYNTDLFVKHGLKPPHTWAEFLAVCQRLRDAGVTPIALGNAQSWPGCFYLIYLATRLGGTEPFAQGRYDHPCFVAAGEKIRELVDRGFLLPGFNGLKYDASRREFFQGRAAMTLMGSWIISHCRNEAPAFLSRMDCFPFPALATGPPPAATVVVGGMNAGYAVSATSKAPAQAQALVAELTGATAAKEWAAAGRIPARPDADLSGGGRPLQSLSRILAGASAIQLYYDQSLPSPLATLHKETTQALFAKALTGKEAAAKMASRARELRQGP